MKQVLVALMYLAATIASLRGKHRAALRWTERALAIDPADPAVLYTAAKAHLRQGQVSWALRLADSITTLYPDRALSWYDKGQILYDIGSYEKAAECFQRTLDLGVRDALLLAMLGKCLLGMGHPEKAEQVFRAALLERPSLLDAALGLATCLIRRDHVEEALSLYEELQRTYPRNSALHRDLAWALLESGRPSEAEDAAERAVELRPGRVGGWQVLAVARIQWRGVEAGREAARRAVALDEPSMAWLEWLRYCAAQREGTEQAWALLRDLASVKPESETLHRMLKQAPPEASSEE